MTDFCPTGPIILSPYNLRDESNIYYERARPLLDAYSNSVVPVKMFTDEEREQLRYVTITLNQFIRNNVIVINASYGSGTSGTGSTMPDSTGSGNTPGGVSGSGNIPGGVSGVSGTTNTGGPVANVGPIYMPGINVAIPLVPKIPTGSPFYDKYPYLSERLDDPQFITQAEVQQFVDTTGIYSMASLQAMIDINSRALLVQLDYAFDPQTVAKATMGSFCSMVPNIFAAFKDFQDTINNIMGYVGKIKGLMDSFMKNGIKGLIDGLVKQLVSKLTGIVDQVVGQIKAKFEGMLKSFSSTFGIIDNLSSLNSNSIAGKFKALKVEVEKVLEDGFVKYIKDKVDALISNAMSLFDKRTFDIEEIQFIILRFCSFAESIEQFFKGKLNPINTLQSNLLDSFQQLSMPGKRVVSSVIGAGGYRMPKQTRMQSAAQGQSVQSHREIEMKAGEGNGSSNSTSGNTSINPTTRRNGQGKIGDITEAELAQIPSFKQVSSSGGYNGLYYAPGGTTRSQLAAKGLPISAGWDNVQAIEIVMLMRLQKMWGRTLTINSAYRPSGVNGVNKSFHMSGQAFDVHMTSDVARFKELARAVGFGGIAYYPRSNFTHIDSGPVRTWKT